MIISIPREVYSLVKISTRQKFRKRFVIEAKQTISWGEGIGRLSEMQSVIVGKASRNVSIKYINIVGP